MKRLIFLISFLFASFFSSITFASTDVPPSITADTDWNQGGNPYIIKGRLTIPRGSSLTINTGVQVVFQPGSVIEVKGLLEVQGTAAGPAVFNMMSGGLQNEIFINGGTAHFANAKIVNGVFLAKDAKLTMEGTDVTKGSGVYLQGSTNARLKNNKIYGNATGVVLDGPVVANLSFNTIVQNTYGLLLKSYSDIVFTNNSIHDNQREVINNTPSMKLGGNYWGTDDLTSVQAKIQGSVDVNPMKNLKDILRVYVRTQLPVITEKMSKALAAKERREEKEDAIALAKLKKAEAMAAKKKAAAPEVGSAEVASPVVEAPVEKAATEKAASEEPAVAEAPSSEASAEVETTTSASKIIAVKSLAPAPHTLKPIAGLPPTQDFGAPEAASTLSNTVAAPPVAVPSAAVLAPPSADMSIPTVPDASLAPPPPIAAGNDSTVPPPPDLGEQMPPSTTSPPVIPPPPSASTDNTPAAVQAPPPANVEPTLDQQQAVKKLDTVGGDIDGMQPPPLDLGPDLSKTDLDAVKPPPSASSLALPPLKDSDVAPPKDLDLPPIDDLGNINLDSRNK